MPPLDRPPVVHDWVSFEEADGTTWIFDATFLMSRWHCIYGQGCKGVLTEDSSEMQQGCCSYGAHFADAEDRTTVRKAAARLSAEDWQFKKVAKAMGGPLGRNDDGEWTTRLVDDACVFLNRPGFAQGAGCALHVGALRAGERPLDWKPDVCWQLPLRLTSETDDHGHVTNTLREWKRRDWGEGGEAFHWWCTESDDAFGGSRRVYEELRDEIIELVGDEPYGWLVAHLGSRPSTHVLPHPARRRR
jgi:hypothetical protein